MINEKIFKEYEKELCEYGDYLPNIIRGLLGKEYTICLLENGVLEKVLEQVQVTRTYTQKESLKEL